jgi:type IV pilus assembly protein PilB
MRVSDVTIKKILLDAGKITKEQVPELETQVETEKKPLQDIVIKNNIVNEKELTKLYADYIEVPFTEINIKELDRATLKLIPERTARKYHVALLGVSDDGRYILAMEDPDDVQAIDFLQKEIDNDIVVTIATTDDILAALDQYRENIGSELTKVITEQDDEEKDDDELDEADLAEDSPIAQTVNLILEYAINSGASDIHIEPRENHVAVRYRVDGILREAQKLPKKLQAALVSRIKILSNLKIDERRAPQDGRFKIILSGRQFAFRVSTLPIVDGEKVVMRILSEGSRALTLEELGYWGTALDTVNRAIVQPHGMILVTGPTGSGKSTSLFSVLSLLNKPDVNISTVEDPVEYRVPGTNQTQVNPKAGMTFIAGLRALLRQDPNIIMVGEIRDGETASLAVQAALTGHLVFSTLHTNNAATCLPRLLDMGIEPFLIASTVRAVVGQRLVRRLCIDCREPYTPDSAVLKQIATAFHADNAAYMKYIHALEISALKGGVGATNLSATNKVRIDELSTTETKINQLWHPRDGGCESCGHTGYRGRMGIYEVLDNNVSVQKLIVSNATSDTIQDQAIKEGMVTMQLDGFIKALRGQTTIEEILRVTSEK